MFRFDLLQQSDIAALLKLVGEVTELPSDKVVRRKHVLSGLLKMIGGRSAVLVEMALPDEGPFARAGAIINVDYSCESEARYTEMCLDSQYASGPVAVRVLEGSRSNDHHGSRH